MGHVLAVANIKGGVGKTSAAVNLAAFLGASGAHCLVVDMDAQGAACRALVSLLKISSCSLAVE